MNIKTELDKYVTTSPDILGGTPVFKHSRVPVKILFDYLQSGENLNEFLENYPSVKKSFAEQVINLLSSFITIIEKDETAA
jgi:uncharacterized protein (DUF433 family)